MIFTTPLSGPWHNSPCLGKFLFPPLPSFPSPPLLSSFLPPPSPTIYTRKRGVYGLQFLKECSVDLLRKQQKWIACMELLKLLRSFVFQRPFKCVSSLVNSLRILTSNFHKVLLGIISFIFF